MKLHHDHGIISLCALRYCFGRRTYMPSLVTDYIMDNWKHYNDKERFLFIRDTKRALSDHFELDLTVGDDCDVATYQNFLTWIEEQPGKEKK